MQEIIMQLRMELAKKLNASRYEHTISVSYTCMALAMRYGCDLDKAELAGLLHDCAKYYNDGTLIKKCEKQKLLLSEDEKKAPAVLHAKYGAWVAEQKYGISDPDILGAIRWHTTGKPEMTLLEKIVFTADYIEPRREKAADLPLVRPLAYCDLDECVYQILKDTLDYLGEKGGNVNPMTNEAYEYYRQIHEEKENKQNESIK